MNNNPNNNHGENNIDDILDILQKKREQTPVTPDNQPTRVDHSAVKPPEKPKQVEISAIPKDAAPEKAKENTEKKEPMQNKPVNTSPSSNTPPKTSATASSAQKNTAEAPKKTTVSQRPASRPTPLSSDVISLDDFDTMSKPSKNKHVTSEEKEKKFYLPGYAKVIIYLAVVISVSVFLALTIINVSNDMFALVKNDKEIIVTIGENATLDDVADELCDMGVINYPFAYKMYVKVKTENNNRYSGNMVSGEHTLNSNMSYDALITTLLETTYNNSIVRVTIPEGYTALDIANLLEEKKVFDKEGKEKFIAMLNDTTAFDYDFISDMPETITDEEGNTYLDTDKKYLLEGYLFPDTYDFYVGENITSVISKFLNNFDNKFDEAFYDRCKELDMSVDEIITLASIIQAEGNNSSDFYLISNVFHNRLAHPSVLGSTYPVLQSDATSAYAFNGVKKASDLTTDEIRNVDSPYNSYKNHGLIPGAICNPGHDAIHAALYPAEYITEVDEKGNSAQIPVVYYYFYTASTNGKTYFSKNLEQHNTFVNADVRKNSEELERLKKLYK